MIGLSIVLTAGTTSVELGGNGVGDVRQLLELLIKVLGGGLGSVRFEPVLSLLDSLEERLLVILLNLATETFVIVDLVLQAVGVVLKLVAGLNALAVGLVLLGILLGLFNHTLNVFGAKAALVVGDSDALTLASAFIDRGDLEDTVGIKLESDLDLRNSTGSRAEKSLVSLQIYSLKM